jgi:6-phosphogluconolactonase (cycloisomerase 2 family)
MIQADPSGRFVIHTDLGLDRIDVWKFDAQRGVLTPNDPPSVALPPGDGPRHFSFHPNGRWFYSIQEEGSTLVLFDYDGASGRLAVRQTISTLPPGFAGSNFCSEILVSADGRFVAFSSSSNNLVAGDTNGVDDVFVRDRLAGRQVSIKSVVPTGAPATANQRSGATTASPVFSVPR